MVEPVKLFITGGTGFIGKHFIERLTKWPAEAVIYVLVRKDVVFSDSRFVAVKGDVRQIEAHADILRSCDYIFHLAANVNFFGGKTDDDKVNFESTKTIVDCLKASPNRLKNLVFISTIGAVDRHKTDTCAEPLTTASIPAPTTLYGKSKLKSEDYIKQSGLPFTVIRPTWVYGKNMREKSHLNSFVTMVFGHIPVYLLNFPGFVSLIYVGDLVSSFISCINNTTVIGKTYFAATEANSIGGLFRVIYKTINGHEPKQIPVPKLFSWIVKKAHSRVSLTVANLFVHYLYADEKEYVKDFNITTPVQFATGVKEVVDSNASLFKRVYTYTSKNKVGFIGALIKQSLYPMQFFKQILPEKGIVLDLGCGEGMLSNSIAQTIEGLQVIGYDKDAKKIEQANQAAPANATFIAEPIENITAENVQAIIINDVLHHHERTKQKALLQKALGCLAPGGLFILKEVDIHDTADRLWTTFWDSRLYPKDTLTFHTPEEWITMLRDMGWKLVAHHRVKHFWPASRNIFVFTKTNVLVP